MKTPLPRVNEIERKWYIVDAGGQTLGRLATQIAMRLRGKHRPIFTPHLDTGDFVIVVNADRVRLTGKKMDKKIYVRHTGYMGGLKEVTARQMIDKKPEEMIRLAVKRMLPKTRLGNSQIRKLKIYRGSEHPHQAQSPETFSFTGQ
ncbi:MAG: 50S ribosomal protein L13 [Desulfobacteraceae bacterium]|nr:50S ribosomal protein L13 [Desulfobacteraceae bacterium]